MELTLISQQVSSLKGNYEKEFFFNFENEERRGILWKNPLNFRFLLKLNTLTYTNNVIIQYEIIFIFQLSIKKNLYTNTARNQWYACPESSKKCSVQSLDSNRTFEFKYIFSKWLWNFKRASSLWYLLNKAERLAIGLQNYQLNAKND